MVLVTSTYFTVSLTEPPPTDSSDALLAALKRDCAMCSSDSPRVSFKRKKVKPAMIMSKTPSGSQYYDPDKHMVQ